MNGWTTASDLRARVAREWEKGRLLAAMLTGESLYPWRIALKYPSAATLSEQFDAVRQWIRALAQEAKIEGGAGYRLEWLEVNHRQLGRNRVPVAALLDSEADALGLIGRRREAARFRALAESVVRRFPQLRPWLARRPLVALDHADDWPRLLEVLAWCVAHPRPGVYLRQIDLPGVHTKFIEQHRELLGELLDRVLPPEAIDADAAGPGRFENRYGFRSRPAQIRFRLLDARLHLNGLSDLAAASAEFARLALAVRRVFITENEINFLAFPEVAGGMVIFGAGYGFAHLAQAAWLGDKAIAYWGDIDTHGFAILDQLRAHFPQACSLLMDRETLLHHRPQWGREDRPTRRELPRLLPEEAALYDDLRADRLAPALRLEQERIGFGWLRAALSALPAADAGTGASTQADCHD